MHFFHNVLCEMLGMCINMNIKIAGIVKESIVDGPGFRYAIFSQGCPHKCKGCHNPDTHDIEGGYFVDTEYLVKDILKSKYIDGVTFSGGEPFLQAEAFIKIAKALKEQRLNIMCYTGYTFEQIIDSNNAMFTELLGYIDTLVDGPYIEELVDRSLTFRGSSNQRLINITKSLKEGSAVIEGQYRSVS